MYFESYSHQELFSCLPDKKDQYQSPSSSSSSSSSPLDENNLKDSLNSLIPKLESATCESDTIDVVVDAFSDSGGQYLSADGWREETQLLLGRICERAEHFRSTLSDLSFAYPPLPSSGMENIVRARGKLAELKRYSLLPWSPFTSSREMIRDRALRRHPPPRGKMSAEKRMSYASESMSALVGGSITALLGYGEMEDLSWIRVCSTKFQWGEAFNKVGVLISGKLGKGFSGQMDTWTRRLSDVIDGPDNDDVQGKTERLGSLLQVLMVELEEFMERLNRLSDALNSRA